MDKKPCVLVIDDDRTILGMYGDFLEKKGFRVFREASGEDALARLIEDREGIDLVVTDIMMARMDGWQFLDYIRKEMKLDEVTLPVIVMSAVESADLDMEYIRHRANDWITKPILPVERLTQKVRALLGLNVGKDEHDESSGDGG